MILKKIEIKCTCPAGNAHKDDLIFRCASISEIHILESDWFIKIFQIGWELQCFYAYFCDQTIAHVLILIFLPVPVLETKRPIMPFDLDQMQNFKIHNIIVNIYPSLYLCIMQILFCQYISIPILMHTADTLLFIWYWTAIPFSSLESNYISKNEFMNWCVLVSPSAEIPYCFFACKTYCQVKFLLISDGEQVM